MADPEFTLEAIWNFMLQHGGKVTNHLLVSHFKKQLADPVKKDETRKLLKEYVNTLAAIKQEEGQKYLVLRKKYRRSTADLSLLSPTSNKPISESSSSNLPELSPLKEDIVVQNIPPTSLKEAVEAGKSNSNQSGEILIKSEDEISNSTTISKDELQFTEVKQMVGQNLEKNSKSSEDHVNVREIARNLNKIQSDSDLIRPVNKKRDKTHEKSPDAAEDDALSVLVDARFREWLIKAAMADYHGLSKLLLKDSRLAKQKDFTSGFTALHWAAKHGKPEVVKLIAGTHNVDVNIRTHGGYTPLHLASMHGHDSVIDLLVNTYGANVNLRDYSGKKAKQYLGKKGPVNTDIQQLLQGSDGSCVTGKKTKYLSATLDRPKSENFFRIESLEKDPFFKRIGSLNAKMLKTGAFCNALINSSLNLKAKGSSESINDDNKLPSTTASPEISPRLRIKDIESDSKIMLPPRIPPKRQKSKKTGPNERDFQKDDLDPESGLETQV